METVTYDFPSLREILFKNATPYAIAGIINEALKELHSKGVTIIDGDNKDTYLTEITYALDEDSLYFWTEDLKIYKEV